MWAAIFLRSFILREASRLHDEFPALPIFAVPGDYTETLNVPREAQVQGAKKVVFFPGFYLG